MCRCSNARSRCTPRNCGSGANAGTNDSTNSAPVAPESYERVASNRNSIRTPSAIVSGKISDRIPTRWPR